MTASPTEGNGTRDRCSSRAVIDRASKLILVLWVPAILVVTALLMVNHIISMPTPTDMSRLRQAVAETRTDSTRPFLLHVIYENCSCTDGLFRHLIERRAHTDATETILYVGDDPERDTNSRRAGFGFVTIDRDELESRFGIEAAPVLVIVNADDELQYVGGYYRYPAAKHSLDVTLYGSARAGERLDPLPVFGCATGAALREAVDPLGLTE